MAITENVALIPGCTSGSYSDRNANIVSIGKFQADHNGTLRKIRMYSAVACSVKVAIYSDNAGSPQNRLAKQDSPIAVSAGWNQIELEDTCGITRFTDYWLACIVNTNSGFRIASTGGTRKRKSGITFSTWTWPTPFDAAGYTDDNGNMYIQGRGDWDTWTQELYPITYIPDESGLDFIINGYSAPNGADTQGDPVMAMKEQDAVNYDDDYILGHGETYYGSRYSNGRFQMNKPSSDRDIYSVAFCFIYYPTGYGYEPYSRILTHGSLYGESGGSISKTTEGIWTTKKYTWQANPNTGTYWTKEELEDMLCGFTCPGTFTGPYIDKFWIEIIYDGSAAYNRGWTLIQQDRRGRPIFLATAKAKDAEDDQLYETRYTDNGIAVFTQLPKDRPVNVEVRWGCGTGAQYRKYFNVFDASGSSLASLVTKAHNQNTDLYNNGVKTSEPSEPFIGNWYADSGDKKLRLYT